MVLNSPGFPSLLSARQGDRFWTESLGLTIKQQSCSNHGYPLPFPFLVPCWSFHLYSTNCVTYLCNVLLSSIPPSLPPSFTPILHPSLPPSLLHSFTPILHPSLPPSLLHSYPPSLPPSLPSLLPFRVCERQYNTNPRSNMTNTLSPSLSMNSP